MFKIAYDAAQLDLNDVSVLQDQLTGVDAAYFGEVIAVLKKDCNKNIDRTYLFELINRVFDFTNDDFIIEDGVVITNENDEDDN